MCGNSALVIFKWFSGFEKDAAGAGRQGLQGQPDYRLSYIFTIFAIIV